MSIRCQGIMTAVRRKITGKDLCLPASGKMMILGDSWDLDGLSSYWFVVSIPTRNATSNSSNSAGNSIITKITAHEDQVQEIWAKSYIRRDSAAPLHGSRVLPLARDAPGATILVMIITARIVYVITITEGLNNRPASGPPQDTAPARCCLASSLLWIQASRVLFHPFE